MVVVQVMQLVQVVAQARHTATRMLEHSAAASSSSSSSSLWWRLTAGLLDAKEAESEDGEQSLRKTGEMLERALENLCHIFKVGQELLLLLHLLPPSTDVLPPPAVEPGSGEPAGLRSGLVPGPWYQWSAARLHPGRERPAAD